MNSDKKIRRRGRVSTRKPLKTTRPGWGQRAHAMNQMEASAPQPIPRPDIFLRDETFPEASVTIRKSPSLRGALRLRHVSIPLDLGKGWWAVLDSNQ